MEKNSYDIHISLWRKILFIKKLNLYGKNFHVLFIFIFYKNIFFVCLKKILVNLERGYKTKYIVIYEWQCMFIMNCVTKLLQKFSCHLLSINIVLFRMFNWFSHDSVPSHTKCNKSEVCSTVQVLSTGSWNLSHHNHAYVS